MRLTRLLAILIVVAAAAGCSKHATGPGPDTTPPSPLLVATSPPARTIALYDTDIWGQFDRPLDPSTVDAQSAFLKLDGQRIPCTVSYDTSAYRVRLQPQRLLLLQRTHTVEFSPTIHTADGTPLPENVFFQFKTNSLRRTTYDFPVRDSLVGPLSRLGWGGSQGPLGDVMFRVYAGPDSVLVANRMVTPIQEMVFTRYLPSAPWSRGSRTYWAVTSEHLTTHEQLHAPVQSFRVFDDTTTVHTLTISAADHGARNLGSNTQYCNNADLPSSPTHNAAVHWSLVGIPANAHIVGATVGFSVKSSTSPFALTEPALYMAQNNWLPCAMFSPGPPFPEVNGLLATATQNAQDTTKIEFRSDRLGAFFEALFRGDVYTFGTVIRTKASVVYYSTLPTESPLKPYVEIRYVTP